MRNLDELTRHQIRLHKGDFEKLERLHRNRKPTDVIRILVRRHIDALEQNPIVKEKLNGINE